MTRTSAARRKLPCRATSTNAATWSVERDGMPPVMADTVTTNPVRCVREIQRRQSLLFQPDGDELDVIGRLDALEVEVILARLAGGRSAAQAAEDFFVRFRDRRDRAAVQHRRALERLEATDFEPPLSLGAVEDGEAHLQLELLVRVLRRAF